ncbi:ATM interactor [Astyanax mexicanus]|uniref:ATM interactor n=1 Tax=Astyanax mexicanus TaxID=7994 RepID=A0A8B9RBI8_ASTMX|nr:ATM interactor [Astyanax mexicanus]
MAAAPGADSSGPRPSSAPEEPSGQPREIIRPSITELTKEVRTNILCTVEGCGKILPNSPALNMHLVKSHRVKEGLVNPTVRKDIKGSQKLYCCPIEGCPRGPNRPFSQFALVKQHFMKMHAEKKHKCVKCSNGYSTEWDLRRHAEDCGRTYSCTCGCPYASRAALLSHIYRTGHEVPKEHRYPPVKKRKMERLSSSTTKVRPNEQTYEMAEGAVPTEGASQTPDSPRHIPIHSKNVQKLLLPKPKVALVNVPVMQLAHLPVLLPSAESSALRSVLLALDVQGSVSTVHLLPQSLGAMVPALNTKTVSFRDTMPASRSSLDAISTGIQVNLESLVSVGESGNDLGSRSKSTSTNIQTDTSYLSKGSVGGVSIPPISEASVSSCSQTDISVSAQIQLPISVQTQTFPLKARVTSSIGAQTDTFSQLPFSSFNITRETQTSCCTAAPMTRTQMDQAIMCTDLFDTDMLCSVSTQTAVPDGPFGTNGLDDEDPMGTEAELFEDRSAQSLCFGSQRDILHQNTVADNQTQTMNLFSDLENILSDSMAAGTPGCGSSLVPVQEQHTGIDFDFEDFLNATHIQTQTDESALGGLNSETPLELLDIETQTDFLLLGDSHQSDVSTRDQSSNDLELEMFDTQTQTDLNFLLDHGGHMPLGSILRHSSFNMSTESSDTETQTDTRPLAPHPPPASPALPMSCSHEGQVRLSSTETQTVSSSSSLGQLFLTSNETQTVMDDFLSADLAWNMESHFSSVETQTSEDLFSLFQHSEKPNS